MEIILYQFSKAPNSTRQPSGGGLSVSGELRDSCDIAAPSIRFGVVETAASLTVYNYAYIPPFGRYYFIRNWEYDLGVWVGSMDVDVLAAYKDVIGASTQYVLRSASHWDGDVVDRAYPSKNAVHVVAADGSVEHAWSRPGIGSPCYILGVSSSSEHFYRMDDGDLNLFMHYLYSDEYANQIMDGWAESYPQLKVNLNPIQYVNSLQWYPFSPASSPSGAIQVGWGEVSMASHSVQQVHSGIYTFNSIPRHPQSAARGDYLNLSPWSSYFLSFPPWGIIQLDSLTVAGCDGIVCRYYVDFTTGGGTLNIYAAAGGGNVLLDSRTSQVGVAVQYTKIVSEGFGLPASAVIPKTLGMIAPALGGGAAAPVAASTAGAAVSLIGDAVEMSIPYGGSTNNGSGKNGLQGPLALYGKFVDVVDEDLPHRGRPLCQRVAINTLTGYVLCSNVEIDAPSATSSELDAITSLMEGGFIFE